MTDVYSDQFHYAAKIVYEHEGGFVNSKNDHGGPTKGGISLTFLIAENIDINGDGKIDEQDIEDLTQEKIIELYYRCFWQRYRYGHIKSLVISAKVLDLALPLGPHEAHLIVQRAMNLVIERHRAVMENLNYTKESYHVPLLVVDGILGDQSIKTINDLGMYGDQIIDMINYEATKVFYLIVKAHPTDEEYIQGWLKRLRK